MSYSYSINNPITISKSNLKKFGWKFETQNINTLTKILLEAGFPAELVKDSYETGKLAPAHIVIYDFGKIPEFGPNSGLTEVKARYDALVELTGGNLDSAKHVATDEHSDTVSLHK